MSGLCGTVDTRKTLRDHALENVTIMKTIAILGSTGSIGRQALEVIAAHRDQYRVVGLAAGQSADLLLEQADTFDVPTVALGATPGTKPSNRTMICGGDSATVLIEQTRPDLVLNAITGTAGLRSSYRTLELGVDLAIANKESIVAAGPLLVDLAEKSNAKIVPVDSEHSAIQQCLRAGTHSELAKIHLTASGGPFRGWPANDLKTVTREEALRHPTWSMGPKITIDSATLMNKALEVIEAHVLFGLSPDRIEVVVHPESVVHSLVEFLDGSFVAHLGATDMRIPIQYALSQPARWRGPSVKFSLIELQSLHFESVDHEAFPAIGYAYEAIERGGTTPAAMNAANESAVDLFLSQKITFTEIFALVRRTLDEHRTEPVTSIEQVLETDTQTREIIHRWTC